MDAWRVSYPDLAGAGRVIFITAILLCLLVIIMELMKNGLGKFFVMMGGVTYLLEKRN